MTAAPGQARWGVVVGCLLAYLGACARGASTAAEAGELGPVVGVDAATPRAAFVVAGLGSDALGGDGQVVLGSDVEGASVLVVRDVGVANLCLGDLAAAPVRVEGPTLSPGGSSFGARPDALVRDVASAVGAEVRRRVAQSRVTERQAPADTWASGRGDCTEIADLTAALLRGVGIPARVAAGVAPHDGVLTWHAWVEYWDGRWATLDPTFGQHPADAGHVRLDVGPDTASLDRLNAARGRVTVRQREVPRGASPGRP